MTGGAGLRPIDLDRVSRELELGSGPSRRPIGLSRIDIGERALDGLAGVVASVRRGGPVVILTDATPKSRGGHELTALVCQRLAEFGAELAVLGDSVAELHADPAALDEATAAVKGAGCVVAVGSGTICDLGKEATNRIGRPPYVVVQTACSVNAFSDDVAVLLLHGVKRTIPSRWVDALVVDLGVVAEAPAALNRSGVGELAAMFTAPADWRLAAALGMDGAGAYDADVVNLFRDGGPQLLALGAGVAARESDALRDLCTLMTLSGLALGIAGRSTPISGAEHTIGHVLDMAAAARGTTTGLHGSQVGVAAIVAAAVWRRVLANLDPDRLTAPAPAPEAVRVRVEAAFDPLDPTGAMAAECWADCARKLERWAAPATEATRRAAADAWPALRAELEALVADPADIVATLRAAGAPTRFSELEPAVDAGTARWAVGSAHLMRERFTVLDLAAFTDPVNGVLVDEVLEECAGLGAGL